MRMVSAAVVVLAGMIVVEAQGLPANYRLQFENAWVRVTEVRYGALERVAPHSHTPYPSAYVYLTDGPPVIFRHVGGKGVAATRAATKAGAFRVYKGLEEVHEVENTGTAPSEFLRVEFKTAPLEPGTFWGKFERPAASMEPVVHFNHPQLRISRLFVAPKSELQIAAATEPALVIPLAGGTGLRVGESRWVAAASSVTFSNQASSSVDLLRFDLKTSPRATR